jgi:ribose 5-phosphate isomerase B
MKIFAASDHAGYHLKQYLVEKLDADVMDAIDLGTNSPEPCDYPIFARKLCESVLMTPGSRGILICSTGIGVSIAANRHRGIRAALCFDEEMAELSRRHNDSNVMVLGSSMMDNETALNCLRLFLNTEFEGGRHARRLGMIDG